MLSWWLLPTSDLGQESSAPSTQGMTDRPALLEPQCSHVSNGGDDDTLQELRGNRVDK